MAKDPSVATLPPGVKLVRTLRGHEDWIGRSSPATTPQIRGRPIPNARNRCQAASADSSKNEADSVPFQKTTNDCD